MKKIFVFLCAFLGTIYGADLNAQCDNPITVTCGGGFGGPNAGGGCDPALNGGFGIGGAEDSFAGAFFPLDALVANCAAEDLCITGTFNVFTDDGMGGQINDPSVYPVTLEYRLENAGAGTSTTFDLVITQAGTYTLGGNFAAGTAVNGGFNPTGPSPQVVVAIGTNPNGSNINANWAGSSIAVNCTMPVPTAGTWGLICLTISFISFGLISVRQEREELQVQVA